MAETGWGCTRRGMLAGSAAALAVGCTPRRMASAWSIDDLPHADIARLDAGALAAGFRSRSLTPEQVAAALLERIDASQPYINAFGHLDRALTMAAAEASGARWRVGRPLGPLDGVPFGVKDAEDFAVAGWPITWGTAAIDPQAARAETDAPIIAKLRAGGMVPLGMTTAPDVYQCVCSTSTRTGITRNPWNLALSAGGSSSGAGAATAAGLGPLHLGTDGGGSVRTPAAWCGVYGVIPGVRFSGYPVGLPGILAQSPFDAARFATQIGGTPNETGWRWPATDYAAVPPPSLRGLTVGWWGAPSPVGVAVDRRVAEVAEAAVRRIADHEGFTVDAVPNLIDRDALVDGWSAGIAETLLATDELISAGSARLSADPWLLELIAHARRIDRSRFAAMGERYIAMISKATADPRLNRFDLILMPTMPVQPFPAERHFPADYDTNVIPFGLDDGGRMLGHTSTLSILGWAAASIPCGFDAQGMPVGLMVGVRPALDDLARCLAISRRIFDIVGPKNRLAFA